MRPLLSFSIIAEKNHIANPTLKLLPIFLYAILRTSRNISASTKDKNSKYPGNPGK